MAVSVRDVATAAGVSVGTVSNVLNRPDKVSGHTRERVLSVIDRLGFVRNDAARQLRAGTSRSVGLVVPDGGNPFFADVARGAEERADEGGLAVLLGNSDEDVNREGRYLDLFREQRVNGVLITPVSGDLSRLRAVHRAGTPIVLVDHGLPEDGFSSVAVDDIEGGYLAVRHLLDTGRRRLLFLGGPPSTVQVGQRLEGARRAVDEVPDAALDVIEMTALTVLQGRAAGQSLVERDAAERPDAVFAANDLLAMGLLQALTMMGDLRVPEDIAIIGYDDIDFAASSVVPLSSIRQPSHLIGRTALDLLLKGIDDPQGTYERQVRFRPELVVRASTAG